MTATEHLLAKLERATKDDRVTREQVRMMLTTRDRSGRDKLCSAITHKFA